MNQSCRRAFTMIELLVVIVIMAVLMSLFMPVMNSVREAARRAQCANNLAQIAMALQSYEQTFEVLPAGVVDSSGPIQNLPQGNHIGWMGQLLPHLDQPNAYRNLDFSVSAYDKKNRPVRRLEVAVFQCPSSNAPTTIRGVGISHYAGCHHDVEAPIDADNHGTFFLNRNVRDRDITDGRSQTLFVGEKIPDQYDLGWLSGTRATLRNTGTPINGSFLPDGPLATLEALVSDYWPEADSDEPEKAETEEFSDAPAASVAPLAVGGFGGYHPGGTNMAFGDGSVRLIRDTIAPAVLQQLGHRSDGKLLNSRDFR